MNSMPPSLLRKPPQVLSTLNADGSRRWLKPRLSHGKHFVRRRMVAWFLLLLFTILPFLKIHGAPVLLLDLANRRFTLLGTPFLATDGPLIGLLVVGIFLTIFLLTTLFGRVWCGYACPQTVYLEFVYRPIERFFDRLHKTPGPLPAALRGARFIVWSVVSLFLANTFLAYFVGVETLAHWMTQSPFQHPGSFLVMAITTILMMVDFVFFREQMCTLTCPYGRFQSVMFDRATRIIGYDKGRGEPRAKLHKAAEGATTPAMPAGDCIDCNACVTTCPTGIDIRNGIQMECVACAQCIDACNSIMTKVNRPLGLIRYASIEELEVGKRRYLRPRVFVYLVLIALVFGLLGTWLGKREPIDVVFQRTRATPFRITESGEIECPLQLHLSNRTAEAQTIRIEIASVGKLEGGEANLELEPFGVAVLDRAIIVPRSVFHDGRAPLALRFALGNGDIVVREKTLVGPMGDEPAGSEEHEKEHEKHSESKEHGEKEGGR